MKEDAPSEIQTSRRQFTKAMVTAAVAAPIVASVASCRKTTPPRPPGVVRDECFPSDGTVLDHIPPMGFDGGGSMTVETRNEVDTTDSRPPFRYKEANTITDERDMYGDLIQVRVITELIDYPYVSDVRFIGLPPDCQLLLWYQKINATPGPSPSPRPGPFDCVYIPDNFNRPPDVQIFGGRKAASNRRFEMAFQNRKMTPKETSYKCSRSFRYKDANDASPRSHFRIGQWRVALIGQTTAILDSNGRPIQDTVNTPLPTPRPEHFRLYVTFDHY